ncbi:MAG TPA: secretion system protein [Moorella mulderi]|nr:secretion system protein [Moorella mulderi]
MLSFSPSLGASVCLFFALFFLAWAWERKRVEEARLLERSLEGASPSEAPPQHKATASWREELGQMVRKIVDHLPQGERILKKLEDMLIQADLAFRAEEYLVLTAAFFLAGGLLGYLLTGSPIGVILMALILGPVPIYLLRFLLGQRLRRFQQQLPDALTLMANAVRAGFGLFQAMEVVRREMSPPITQEFARVLLEHSLGMDAEVVLRRLGERIPNPELDLAITAIIVQRRTGGNLGEILDSIADTIRERMRLADEVNILTAQARISALILSLLPIGLGLVIYFINPPYIVPLFTHPLGRALLVAGVAGEVLGSLFMFRLMEVE